MFPSRSVCIVVRRVAIHEAVDEEAVERESPIVRGFVVGVVAKNALVELLHALRCVDFFTPIRPSSQVQ